MTPTRALVAVTLSLAMTVAVPALGAEPTAAEKETARSLMDDGYGRRDRGDHAGALASFGGADAIMHVPTTGLEVAREQAALGRVVEARDTLVRVLRVLPGASEPEPFRQARAAGRALDSQLASRIAGLRVSLRGFPEGAPATLTIDGVKTPPAALAAPLRVNPGHHVVLAQAPGGAARQEVDVADGETRAVTLVMVAEARAPAPVASPPSDTTRVVLRWGGAGLAGAGIAVGTIAGILSLSATSSARGACVGDRCPPAAWGDLDTAHSTATVSTIGFAAAGVGAAAVIVSFLLRGPADASATASAGPAVTPWIGAGFAGARGSF